MTIEQMISKALIFREETSASSSETCPVFVMREIRPHGFQATVYEPVICLILQGAKETGTDVARHRLTPGDVLLITHDMPVTARITEASPEKPYTAVILRLDMAILRGLAEEVAPALSPQVPHSAMAMETLPASPTLLDALGRFLLLRPGTAEARVLSGAILREIHFRLLDGPGGAGLRSLINPGSHASRIARAIDEIRRNYSARLTLPDLARVAAMGQSTFHMRFREITGTSPLQYQKEIRLTEAQRLLRQEGRSVGAAAFAVGYESAAQFSREYARKFGAPPSLHRVAEASPA